MSIYAYAVPLAILVTLSLAGAMLTDSRRRVARDDADDLEAARLRLLDEGVDVDATVADSTAYRVDYMSPTAVAAEVTLTWVEPVPDARIIELTVDPTLSPADVVTAIEHVAPGVGSLASFAATVDDTRMRTPSQARELEAAWDEALAEVPSQEERLYYAAFELRWQAMLTDFEVGTRAVRRATARHHVAGEDTCPACLAAVGEVSDEFAQIVARVESESTGEISRADIDAMYAAAPVAA